MGWPEFAAALGVFLVSHAVPVRPPVKPWLVGLLGQRGFTLGYSLLSLAVLAWLIAAAGRAPFVMLWAWKPWHNHLVLAVMAVVCLILALAIGRSEEHTSELQSLMRISYAVFCLKKKKKKKKKHIQTNPTF